MKKLLSFACASLLIFSMAACQKSGTAAFKFTDIDSLKNARISVQTGTQGDEIATALVGKDKVTGFAKYADAITALKQFKVDATFMDELPAKQIVKANPDLKIVYPELATDEYAIAMAKDNTKLAETVNAVIAELQAKQEIEAMINAYETDEKQAASKLDYNTTATAGVLTLGTEAGFAPYETKLGDKIVGADIELAQYIAKKLGLKLEVVDMDFDALIPAVKAGKVDMVAAGMSINPERQKEVLFSNTYFAAKQVAVIRVADDMSTTSSEAGNETSEASATATTLANSTVDATTSPATTLASTETAVTANPSTTTSASESIAATTTTPTN